MKYSLYGLLFEDLDLRSIEIKYLKTDELQGFFAKGVLNLLGIDTSKASHNKGRYKDKDVHQIALSLIKAEDERLRNIGRILYQIKKNE